MQLSSKKKFIEVLQRTERIKKKHDGAI